mmetsp:Transcript_12484/g.20986  ORF Transcript_12484/g.20986 Transcript_12484/m.20986 type:complete len:156 (+) Transcript_12484:1024-1491(+)
MPVLFDPERAVKNNDLIWQYYKEEPCRYGIIDRYSEDPSQVRWFTLPSHYVFHYINAWEETNAKGEKTVVTIGPAWYNLDFDFNSEHPEPGTQRDTTVLLKFVFNLSTGEAAITDLGYKEAFEFPTIELGLAGYKNKYAYMVYENDYKGGYVPKD